MSDVKYLPSRYGDAGIREVEIERETESCIWIRGRRVAKRSAYDVYFDTWDEAHAHMLDKATNELEFARSALQRAQGRYGNVKGLVRPKTTERAT